LAGLPVAGTVTTGDDPDRGVIVPLADMARMKDGMAGEVGVDRILAVDRIEVRARYDRLEETARAIEARVAGAEARSLARVTVTETTMAEKIQHLMIGVGAVCLLLALATVGSATLALLEERRREMALFLALGYTGRWVQGLLTAELALVGLVSVVAGGLLGEGAAAALARTLLGAGPEGAFAFRPSVAGLATGCLSVAVLVALAAAVVRFRVERLDPAPVLQGR
jgi:predicted lysophospholipase L1 biosynthesis ABC-type transport system permease subunit